MGVSESVHSFYILLFLHIQEIGVGSSCTFPMQILPIYTCREYTIIPTHVGNYFMWLEPLGFLLHF